MVESDRRCATASPTGTVRGMSITTALREVAATRYVTPLREGGSLPGLVEADDDGLYVAKFRGAGQGLRALVAEVIVGELARRIELLVPEMVTLEIDPVLGAAEPDPEIQELIGASAGSNLGVDFLPGALPYVPGGASAPDPDAGRRDRLARRLTTNVDRTPRNPNLLLWHGRLWLIDHGAALYLHHAGLIPAEHADRPFPLISEHVLLPHAGLDQRRARTDRAAGHAAVAAGDRRARAARLAGGRPARPRRRMSSTCRGACAAAPLQRRRSVPERDA